MNHSTGGGARQGSPHKSSEIILPRCTQVIIQNAIYKASDYSPSISRELKLAGCEKLHTAVDRTRRVSNVHWRRFWRHLCIEYRVKMPEERIKPAVSGHLVNVAPSVRRAGPERSRCCVATRPLRAGPLQFELTNQRSPRSRHGTRGVLFPSMHRNVT